MVNLQMNPLKVILASGSPRRRQFLQALGLPHVVRTAEIDETPGAEEAATELAQRLAREKALAVAQRTSVEERPVVVIGADTVVALGDTVLGKPASPEEAVEMLRDLRQEPHMVHSAIALVRMEPGGAYRVESRLNSTRVLMRDYTDQEIARYVATGDPLDKAGGYAIQHRVFAPVTALDGCAAGVMGLPLADLVELLGRFGLRLQVNVPAICADLTGLPCCQAQGGTMTSLSG